MKVKPLFIVILLISFSFVNAQEYSFGLKGGINFNTIGELDHYGPLRGGGSQALPALDVIYEPNKEMGAHFGAFAMIAFDKFFIRPELSYASLKSSYTLLVTANWKLTKIDVPILLGYKIYDPVSLYAGPSFSSISNMELQYPEYPILFEKSAVNLNAGILADFGRFGFDLRYEYGLKPIKDQRVDFDGDIYGTNVAHLLEYNPSQIILSVHINIIKINSDDRGHRIKSNWRGGSRGCSN